MNLGGFSNISQGRSESREKFQGKPMRINGRGGNPRYGGQPRNLFQSQDKPTVGYDANGRIVNSLGMSATNAEARGTGNTPFTDELSPATPQGYGSNGSLANLQGGDVGAGTGMTYGGGHAASYDATPSSITGLTPIRQGYQAPNVLAMEPGVKTSTYAFQDMPKPGVQQNIKLNLDKPSPTPTTIGAQQTESSNPLAGDTNAQPTGKTTGITQKTLAVGQPQGQQPPAGSVTGLKTVQPASNQSLAQGSVMNEGYDANGNITSSASPDIDHARALGVSTKGNGTPAGDDVSTPGQPSSFAGGSGDSQRSFSNPTSAAIYGDYVKKLFGGGDGSQPTGYAANGTSLQTGQDQASAMAKQLKAKPQPQENAQV